MTKAARILALHAEGKTTRQIAVAVYGEASDIPTKMSYVRVVLRQRHGGSRSAIDIGYMQRRGRVLQAKRKKERYARDPELRAKQMVYWCSWLERNREHRAAYERKYSEVRKQRRAERLAESQASG